MGCFNPHRLVKSPQCPSFSLPLHFQRWESNQELGNHSQLPSTSVLSPSACSPSPWRAPKSLWEGGISREGKAHCAPRVGGVASSLRGRRKPCPDSLDLHLHPGNLHIWPGPATAASAAGAGAEICAIPEQGIGKMFIFLHRKMMTH